MTLVPGTPLFSAIHNSPTLSTIIPQIHIILLDLVYHERKQGDVNQHDLNHPVIEEERMGTQIEDPDDGPEKPYVYELNVDDVLDGYKVVRPLGHGGLGEVYEAYDVGTARRVALKVMLPEHARKSVPLQRFRNEGLYMGRLRNAGPRTHPFPEVYRAGQGKIGEREYHYIALEFFQGFVLDTILEATPGHRLLPLRAINLMCQVLEALQAMHDEKIVHRDLKPDNLMIVRDEGNEERVKILDLGIARSNGTDASMTKSGTVVGTPYYMSPQQARGGRVDHRSDLYSVGVILFECVAGYRPFERDSLTGIILEICEGTPAEMPGDIDPRLRKLTMKAMAREPEARFQTADEFRVALLKLQEVMAPAERPLRSIPTVTEGSEGAEAAPILAASLPPPPPSTTAEPIVPRPPAVLKDTAADMAMSVDTGDRDRIFGRRRPLLVILVAAVVAAVVAAIALWPSRTPTRRPAPVATSDRPVTPVVPTPVATPEPPRPTPVPVATPEPPRPTPVPVVEDSPRRGSQRSSRHRREHAPRAPTCVRMRADEDADGTPIYRWLPAGCVRR